MEKSIFEVYGDQVRSHLVEIQINNTGGKYFFPDDAILREQKIVGLSMDYPYFDEANSADFVLNSPDSDRPLIIADAFVNGYLYLLNASNLELLFGVPFTQFAVQPGDRTIQQIFADGFSPSKSYVEIAAPATAGRITTGQSIIFHFWYLGGSSTR